MTNSDEASEGRLAAVSETTDILPGGPQMLDSKLERPVLSIRDAAWQMGIGAQTLGNWLEGYTARNGRRHPPVLRIEPTGQLFLTWGEYVEAFYLTAYRFDKKVPLQRIRPFIEAMRQEFQVRYPLAHMQPYVDESRQLLLKVQQSLDLPDELWMVFQGSSRQLVLNPTLQTEFLSRVVFNFETAQRILPIRGEERLTIDPGVRSGTASILGVPARLLMQSVEAGDTLEAVATSYDLEVSDVELAVAFARLPRAA